MNSYVIRQGERIAVETIKSDAKPNRRMANSFAQVPLGWAAAAAKATKTPRAMVWVLLQHMAWQNDHAAFPVSNAVLAKYGVSREVKRRALASLESSGLIVVERRHGRAPVVTLIEA
jgi:Bacterial regulatory proteins, gntR family